MSGEDVKQTPTSRVSIMILFIMVAALTLAFDQITKQLVIERLEIGESRTIIEGSLNLVHVRNRGAAFGLWGHGDSNYRDLILLGVSGLVVIIIPFVMINYSKSTWLVSIALGLFWAGAAGNFIDRLRFSEVVDFIDIHWRHYHWPAFNVADASLCIATFLLAVHFIFIEDVKGPQ